MTWSSEAIGREYPATGGVRQATGRQPLPRFPAADHGSLYGRSMRAGWKAADSWVLEDVVVADAAPPHAQLAIDGDELEGGSAVGTCEGPGHLPHAGGRADRLDPQRRCRTPVRTCPAPPS